MEQDYNEILNKLIEIFSKYAQEYRATTQPYRLEQLLKIKPDYAYNPDEFIFRENLMEHVGSLPIVASILFPYLNDTEVNLGHALEMLAVHDIGELVIHDEITFTKKTGVADKEAEQKAALSLIHPILHDLYFEIEAKETKSAKFAKSIDKITPDIIDLITPVDITVKRYEHFVKAGAREIVPIIKKFKHPYMQWNKFLTGLHLKILERLDERINEVV